MYQQSLERGRGPGSYGYIVASYPGGPRSNAPRLSDRGCELCDVRAVGPDVDEVEVQDESCGLTYCCCALFVCLPSEEAAKEEDEDDDGAMLLGYV